MPPLDSTSTLSTHGARGTARTNAFGWADPNLLMPPDVGAPARKPAPRHGRVAWSVEPVPAWPAAAPGAAPGMAPVKPRADGTPSQPPAPGMGRANRPAKPLGQSAAVVQAATPTAAPVAVTELLPHLHRLPPDAQPVVIGPDWQRDFGPSRLAYRLNRLWLSRGVRPFVRLGLPVLLVALIIGVWLSDEARRQSALDVLTQLRTSFVSQPMFIVNSVEVTSRSPEVAEGVRNMLAVPVPISSWDLDLHHLREVAQALDAVDTASVQVTNGVLQVRLTERLPAMVWRHDNGLDLVDARGFRVARLTSRAARPDLPLIAGEGAPAAIAEARLLLAAAQPWANRIRGLVRVGERRWDVVLDSGQQILLPANGALGALERVMALDATQQLLQRDVSVVDMRLPARPTLRLSPEGAQALAEIRRMELEGGR